MLYTIDKTCFSTFLDMFKTRSNRVQNKMGNMLCVNICTDVLNNNNNNKKNTLHSLLEYFFIFPLCKLLYRITLFNISRFKVIFFAFYFLFLSTVFVYVVQIVLNKIRFDKFRCFLTVFKNY